VRQALKAGAKPKQTRHWDWRWLGAIAAVILIVATAMLWYPFRPRSAPGQSDDAFLTEQALKELEQSESAYTNSIAKLSRLAESHLQRGDAGLSSAYKEKLAMLDSAIAELKSTVDRNRFNARLQAELAALYKQKQQTLQEIVREQKN
jgi:flagellar biosynthesis/type III secretory pathway M-ring protein FliF/YscJ